MTATTCGNKREGLFQALSATIFAARSPTSARPSLLFRALGLLALFLAAHAEAQQVPSAPQLLTPITVNSEMGIALLWQPPSTNSANVTGYVVHRCEGAGCTAFAAIATTLPTANTNSYADNTLRASTTYRYRLFAQSAAGDSPYSAIGSVTTLSFVAPTNLVAYSWSATALELGWVNSTSAGTSQHIISWCAGFGCSDFSYTTSATPGGSRDVVATLSPETTYNFRVHAIDPAGNRSGYSNVVTATTPAPDTQAPSTPSGLTATTATTTRINLAWTGSSDNIRVAGYELERCTGAACTDFSKIDGTSVTSYADSLLAPTTTYSYRIRAVDGTGNVSGYSNVATATTLTPDITPPSAPANLAASVISGSQVDLIWTASTDNVGVAAYRVERCAGTGCSNYAQVAAPVTPNYSNTNLTNVTTYSFRIRAADGAGNLSGYSNAVTVFTPDTTSPSVPINITTPVRSATQISLAWGASVDNVGVNDYRVERCTGSSCTAFIQIGTSTTPGYSDTGVTPNTTYRYRMRASDVAGNLSLYSSIALVATLADTIAPSAPTGLTATSISGSQINLVWAASTDNAGVTGYRIERCTGAGCSTFTQIATTTTALAFNNISLTSSTSYSYRVRAVDAAGNLSAYSTVATASTRDVTAPTAPSGLAATITSSSQVNLVWTASTDNIGVASYFIERCAGTSCTSFRQVAMTATTGYSDNALMAVTAYRYRVRAGDAAGNFSSYSAIISITTPTDTIAPTAPTGLTASTVAGTFIALKWNASTDNAAVTGYQLERCQGINCTAFGLIAAISATAYSDTSTTPFTTYSYRVRAKDATLNWSAYSSVYTVTTESGGPITFTYSYDTLGRLTQASGSDGSLTTYSYDANGNVTRINRQ